MKTLLVTAPLIALPAVAQTPFLLAVALAGPIRCATWRNHHRLDDQLGQTSLLATY
jgi:hypothetical protein